jgi:ESS family glutamate:Na+ symporter
MVNEVDIPLIVSMTIAILCLYIGMRINHALKALHSCGIPNVVTGGLVVASGCGILFMLTGMKLNFDISARDVLLLYFFSSIGLNVKFSDVLRGGKPLVILIILTAVLIIIQNVVSHFFVSAFSLSPSLRVLLGSLALTGGHGTVIAWSPMIDGYFGIENSLEIGFTLATLGMITGSLIGGPIAHKLIMKFNLKSDPDTLPVIGLPEEMGKDGQNDINHLILLRTIAFIHIAILFGYGLDAMLHWLNIQMPLFVSALIMAMIIANLTSGLFPRVRMPARSRALALISDLSLELFLALSLMSMQLWQLSEVGLPILIIFTLHTCIAVLYIRFIVFPLIGKNYDAAVISSGFTGIALGSTATAFTNMSTTTSIHGTSSKPFLLLSMVAALFLDIANSMVVSLLML